MDPLFIHAIANKDWPTLQLKGAYILIICTCVLIAMVIDLIAGIRKARRRGEVCPEISPRLKREMADRRIRRICNPPANRRGF